MVFTMTTIEAMLRLTAVMTSPARDKNVRFGTSGFSKHWIVLLDEHPHHLKNRRACQALSGG